MLDQTLTTLFKAFERFVYRDVMYAAGGITILGSIVYLSGRWPLEPGGVLEITYLLIAGYITGYGAQSAVSLTPAVTTVPHAPGPYVRWWLRRDRSYGNTYWEEATLGQMNLSTLWSCIDEHIEENLRERINRISNLRHLSSAIGSSLILATPVLIVAGTVQSVEREYWAIPSTVGLLAIVLLHQNAIMRAHQTELEVEAHRMCQSCTGRGIEAV